MTNTIKNYIMLLFLFGFILLFVLANLYETKRSEAVSKYKNIDKLLSSIENNKDKFTFETTKTILNSPAFKQYIQTDKKGRKTTIVFEAPLNVANAFIRKLANSDSLIGEIEIQKLKTKIKITIRINDV